MQGNNHNVRQGLMNEEIQLIPNSETNSESQLIINSENNSQLIKQIKSERNKYEAETRNRENYDQEWVRNTPLTTIPLQTSLQEHHIALPRLDPKVRTLTNSREQDSGNIMVPSAEAASNF